MKSEAYSGRLKYPRGDTCIPCRHLFLFGTLLPLLITLFIATSVPVAESLSTAAPPAHSTNSGKKCGGAAECGEEFLMDSQTATWLLSSLHDNTQRISYKAMHKSLPVCDSKRSGSCVADKVNGGNSKCDFHNRSCVHG